LIKAPLGLSKPQTIVASNLLLLFPDQYFPFIICLGQEIARIPSLWSDNCQPSTATKGAAKFNSQPLCESEMPLQAVKSLPQREIGGSATGNNFAFFDLTIPLNNEFNCREHSSENGQMSGVGIKLLTKFRDWVCVVT
jgi:hypothetical protein